MHHNPQIDPFMMRGNNGAGVLLIHGFTGTPDSMRPVANKLAERGFTVLAPLLAGHGTVPENLAETDWKDWYASAQKAFMELSQQCNRLFVVGLSMGGLLTLKLAMDYPQSISAISTLATPLFLHHWPKKVLPFIRRSPLPLVWKYQKKVDIDIKDPLAKPNFYNYDRMPLSCIFSLTDLQEELSRQLYHVHTPLLLIHSRHDSTAPYDSMNAIASGVSSTITETVTLENSYHIITLDYEKDLVAQKVTDFFGRFL